MCSRLVVSTEDKLLQYRKGFDYVFRTIRFVREPPGFHWCFFIDTTVDYFDYLYEMISIKSAARWEENAGVVCPGSASPSLRLARLLAGWHSGFSYSPESWRSRVQFFAQPCVEVALNRTLKYTPTRWLWGWRQRVWLLDRFISNLSILTVVGKSGQRLEVEVQTAQPPSSLRTGLETEKLMYSNAVMCRARNIFMSNAVNQGF